MSTAHTCNDLGVCNSRHCADVSCCPDFDLLACNDTACDKHAVVAAKGLCPYKVPQRRFSDRPGCAGEAYPQPTYPFAPGVIERTPQSDLFDAPADEYFQLSRAEAAQITGMAIAATLVYLFAGWWHVTH